MLKPPSAGKTEQGFIKTNVEGSKDCQKTITQIKSASKLKVLAHGSPSDRNFGKKVTAELPANNIGWE
jgi:hypothetical protein